MSQWQYSDRSDTVLRWTNCTDTNLTAINFSLKFYDYNALFWLLNDEKSGMILKRILLF